MTAANLLDAIREARKAQRRAIMSRALEMFRHAATNGAFHRPDPRFCDFAAEHVRYAKLSLAHEAEGIAAAAERRAALLNSIGAANIGARLKAAREELVRLDYAPLPVSTERRERELTEEIADLTAIHAELVPASVATGAAVAAVLAGLGRAA